MEFIKNENRKYVTKIQLYLLLPPWNNILSWDDIFAGLAFDLFFARVNTLLDEHTPKHKLSKKGISVRNIKMLET